MHGLMYELYVLNIFSCAGKSIWILKIEPNLHGSMYEKTTLKMNYVPYDLKITCLSSTIY